VTRGVPIPRMPAAAGSRRLLDGDQCRVLGSSSAADVTSAGVSPAGAVTMASKFFVRKIHERAFAVEFDLLGCPAVSPLAAATRGRSGRLDTAADSDERLDRLGTVLTRQLGNVADNSRPSAGIA